MRRPWMVISLAGGSLGILLVSPAPNIAVLLAGWSIVLTANVRYVHRAFSGAK